MFDIIPQDLLNDSSPDLLLISIVLTFVIAGTVKGAVGLGMTAIPVGLLTTLIDLKTAMALVVLPALATNVWQVATGGHARTLIERLWPFLIVACVTIPVGSLVLNAETLTLLSVLLGFVLVFYSAVGLSGARLLISHSRERWWGPTFGAMNGVLTGMTGAFVFPGIVFLQGLDLSREKLIQAMGMLFTVSTFGLAFALSRQSLLTTELTTLSAIALIPTALGMLVGQHIRNYLSEAQFRMFFLVALMCLGTYVAIAGTV